MTQTYQEALNSWLERVNKISYKPVTSDKPGRKYTRILCDGSAFCFIENATGIVLKADSWSKPAPQPRGTIYIHGREGVDRWGAIYLKG